MIFMRINKKDLSRIFRALDSVIYRARWWAKTNGGELCRRGALGYSQLLVGNIMAGKFGAGYPAYNDKYKVWKKKFYGNRGWWRLKDDLVTNISYFKEGSRWMGGIRSGIWDSGGKSWLGKRYNNMGKITQITKYARINEAKRPIFKPTAIEYAAGEWPRLGKMALIDVANSWR